MAVNHWYNEIKNYDFKNPGKKDPNGSKIGHFTQLVWKDSVYLGVGIAKQEQPWNQMGKGRWTYGRV